MKSKIFWIVIILLVVFIGIPLAKTLITLAVLAAIVCTASYFIIKALK